MFNKIILNIVISFVLRQLAKFQTQINWTQVEKDLDDRVRAVLPGTWFDDDAVRFVNSILAGVQHALADSSKLQAIMTALGAQDWTTAYNTLKILVLGAWNSGDVASTAQARSDIIA